MADHPGTPFFLADFLVEPSLNRISGSGRDERVPLKMMQVLLVLAERPGRVVERDHLMDRIWGDTVVEEAVLTRAVSDLRKVFDDNAREQSVIETIPKVGYRLVAPVQPATGGDSQANDLSTPSSGLPTAFDVTIRSPDARVPTAVSRSRSGAIRWLQFVAVLVVLAAILWVTRGAGDREQTSSAPVPVTTLTGAEFEPSLSPDGRRVAFSRDTEDGNVDLFVVDRNGSGLQRLTNTGARNVGAAWSPDGLRIAYLRKEEDSCSIQVVSPGGGPHSRLTGCRTPANDNLDWSPDGRLLAYSARPSSSESFSIFLVDVETGEERRLTRPTEQYWGDRFPRFSPDGAMVAFSRSVSMATQDVFVIGIDSADERPITTDHRTVLGLDWSADGRSLLVATNRSGVEGLWRIPSDGSDPTWLARAGSGVRQPSVSMSGDAVVYMQETDISEILRFDPGSGRSAVEPTLTSSRYDLQPAFSPDASMIAFSSNRSGSQEIWVAPADTLPGTTPARRITSFAAGFTGSPAWSPDGRRIAFDARPGGQPDIYVVDAAGGVPRQITRSAAGDFSPAFSADGRTIFFGSNRSGDWQIWRIDLDGGDPQPVTTDGGFAVHSAVLSGSPVLIHTRYDRTGLWTISEAGGETRELVLPGPLSDHESFTVRDGLIYAVVSDGRIVRLDPASRTTAIVETGEPASRRMGLSVAPDGSILFGRRGPSSSDLMLLDL